jgi:hypothetical protein
MEIFLQVFHSGHPFDKFKTKNANFGAGLSFRQKIPIYFHGGVGPLPDLALIHPERMRATAQNTAIYLL